MLKNLFLLLVFFIVFGCAHPGSPGGGPKDMRPPEVLKTEPLNRSAHFNSAKITITFDEFIELDNITQKAIISPPMAKLPDFKVKGKSLQIKFNEALKDSTTYSIYFADAIVDITEKNPLLNYTYIFSTGSKVDSLSLFGNVINAFDREVVESVFVLLYKDNNDTLPIDSLPYHVIPYYVSKTTVNGDFQFSGLGNSKYLMFALKDLNANYIYDQPGEEIAFLDTLIRPFYVPLLDIDSLRADSARFMVPDTLDEKEMKIVRDSLIHAYIDEYQSGFQQIELSLFKEADSTQRLLKADVLRDNNIQFSFAWPADDIELTPMNFSADTTWYVERKSKNGDTINWFLRDLPVDTLEVYVTYRQDSLEYLYLSIDPDRSSLSRRQQKKEDEKKEYLEIKTNIKGGKMGLTEQPEIYFYHPVKEVISDSILLVVGEDSTYSPPYEFVDSLRMNIRFPVEVVEDTRYSLVIPDSAIIDWNGIHNQQKTIRFTTATLRDFGVFILNAKPVVDQDYIVQLMSEKQDVLKEYYFSSDTTITISHLDPNIYLLKLIYDNNGNKKWDSGNYKHKIQPEKVMYYKDKIQVRANWEMEEEWIIEP